VTRERRLARRRPLAAAALAAVALIAGCGGHARRHPTPTPSPRASEQGARPPSPAGEVEALLARRARALQAGDAAALAATSVGRQRARDRRAARRAGALRLRDVNVTADPVAGRAGRLTEHLTYGLAGAAGTFGATRDIRAVRTAAGWRIASERPQGGRDRAPWDVTAFRRVRTRHFLLLVPPGVPAAGLAAALETGRRQVAAALPGVRVPDHLAVLVAASADQARALTRRIQGIESLAAVAEAIVRVRGPAERVSQVAGQRLIVIWPEFAAQGAVDRQRVVTHELTHAALAARTSGRTPSWLVEGVALFASDDRRAGETGRLLAGAQPAGGGREAALGASSLTALARPTAIGRLTGIAQAAAYGYASAAAFAIAQRFGREGLMRLYDAFNDPALRGPHLQARAIRKALHEPEARLAAQIRDYALGHAG
jgi:hypothetical protein